MNDGLFLAPGDILELPEMFQTAKIIRARQNGRFEAWYYNNGYVLFIERADEGTYIKAEYTGIYR